jgi:hypothetical protein
MATACITAAALSLAGITQLSCRHETSPLRDATAETTAGVAQRLGGRWTLVSFQPEVSLEPALQQYLNAQIEQLVVDFSGNTLHARGPGVDVTRTFRVTEAYGDHFNATVYDSSGVGTNSVCDFSGNALLVNTVTLPWHGRSTFRRVP